MPRPHFAPLPIQPLPAIVSTAGRPGVESPSGSCVKSHRMSSLGGGNRYLAFGINVNDRIVESETSRSGFAMTERNTDERVCYSLFSLRFCLLFGSADLESDGSGRSCQEIGSA